MPLVNETHSHVTCDECGTEIDLQKQKVARTFDRKGDYDTLCCPICKSQINILVKPRKL